MQKPKTYKNITIINHKELPNYENLEKDITEYNQKVKKDIESDNSFCFASSLMLVIILIVSLFFTVLEMRNITPSNNIKEAIYLGLFILYSIVLFLFRHLINKVFDKIMKYHLEYKKIDESILKSKKLENAKILSLETTNSFFFRILYLDEKNIVIEENFSSFLVKEKYDILSPVLDFNEKTLFIPFQEE